MTTPKELREIIEWFYDYPADSPDPGNLSGGPLHMVIDDGSLSDEDINYCLENTLTDDYYPAASRAVGVVICEALLKMSMKERRFVYEGVWEDDWRVGDE